LQRIIEIARYAPTASNSQLVEWVVISDPNQLRAISSKSSIISSERYSLDNRVKGTHLLRLKVQFLMLFLQHS